MNTVIVEGIIIGAVSSLFDTMVVMITRKHRFLIVIVFLHNHYLFPLHSNEAEFSIYKSKLHY